VILDIELIDMFEFANKLILPLEWILA